MDQGGGDLTSPIPGVLGLLFSRQGHSNEKRDPTCSTKSFRIFFFTPGKVGATREEIQPFVPGVSGLFCSRQGRSNKGSYMDLTFGKDGSMDKVGVCTSRIIGTRHYTAYVKWAGRTYLQADCFLCD